MGMTAILVMWPGTFEQTVPRRLQMKFGFNRPVVLEEKMFENVDINTYIHTYIRTTEAYLSYKVTTEPKGSGELIKKTSPVSVFSLSSLPALRKLSSHLLQGDFDALKLDSF